MAEEQGKQSEDTGHGGGLVNEKRKGPLTPALRKELKEIGVDAFCVKYGYERQGRGVIKTVYRKLTSNKHKTNTLDKQNNTATTIHDIKVEVNKKSFEYWKAKAEAYRDALVIICNANPDPRS